MTAIPSSPLRLPLFRSIWIASLCSNFGGLIQSVGASWTMAGLGGSPQMIALVQASTSLPIMLLSLWAGAIADNLERRQVLLAAQSFMLLVAGTLALGTWLGMVTPWLLLTFTFLLGCGTAINSPAWQASVGDMVPRQLLPAAVAFNSMGFNIARSLGPAIGGAIVATAGAATAFLVNSVSYFGLIIVLTRWRPDLPPRRLPRERLGLAMAAGVRYVRLSPHIREVLWRAALFGLSASAFQALMPLVARDLIGGGPLIFGLLLGAFGLGAVGGALIARNLRERLSTEGIVAGASLLLASGAVMTATGVLPLALLGLVGAGAGWVAALSTFNISVQLASPRWVVARAIALYQMAAFGGMAIGSWLVGWLASSNGVRTALLAAGVAQLLNAVAGRIRPLPAISQLDLAPRDAWIEPQTAIPVEARSGPVIIAIEHRVSEHDIPAFLTVMHDRRRIHLRDGARNWVLARDLEVDTLWTEQFGFPTWLDYVRHNERRTHADAIVSNAMRSLWIEGTEAVVRRRIERQTSSLPFIRTHNPVELDPMTDPVRSS